MWKIDLLNGRARFGVWPVVDINMAREMKIFFSDLYDVVSLDRTE